MWLANTTMFGTLSATLVFVWSLYKLLRSRTSSKPAGMSESPCNLTFVVSEGSCSTSCTTAEVQASDSCTDMATGSHKGRQGCRLGNFFAGKSRSAYGLSPEPERRLSSSGTSATCHMSFKTYIHRNTGFRTTYASKCSKTAPICTAHLCRKLFSCLY